MQKTAPRFTETGNPITLAEVELHAQSWLLDGQIRQLSKRTLEDRTLHTEKLLWFLRQRGFTGCGLRELRSFFAYLNTGHESAGGRWANEQLSKPLRPRTVHKYYGDLRTFFRFLIEEGVVDSSPMEAIKPPVCRADQIQPYTDEQIAALVETARKSRHRRRDEAIILFLLDTGCRASEVCALKVADLDMQGRRCTVLGKGNKSRSVYFGRETTRALWAYLKEEPHEGADALFLSDRGIRAGEPLTRSGLLQLIERIGKAARLENVRCSPHTFRHTFAVAFLRNGGNVFTLRELLGHTTLHMTNRYVALAQADIQNQHRQFSPVDNRKKR